MSTLIISLRQSVVIKNSKTCVKRPLSIRPKICFQDQLSLNAGQKYCRMPQGEHSAILLTFIKLPFVFKIFVLSFLEWLFYTGFTLFKDQLSTLFPNRELSGRVFDFGPRGCGFEPHQSHCVVSLSKTY